MRITDESTQFDKIKKVEVYAEGQVRPAREQGQPQGVGRAVARTAEIRLNCFQPKGLNETKNPPWQLQIIKRSGLREKKQAIAKQLRRAGERAAIQPRSILASRS